MPAHPHDGSRLRLRFAVVIAMTSAAVSLCGCEHRRGLPVGVKKSRQILAAISHYEETEGRIPYDERGPEYALYRLHDLIDADQFQLTQSETTKPPRWDHNSQRLVGGDVLYINRPLRRSDNFGAIIFMGTAKAGERWAYVGHLGFGPWMAAFAATPDNRILGSFRTVDDLYVVGSSTFEDVAITHVASGHSWSTTSGSDRGLISANVGDRELQYDFVDGCIRHCRIRTPRGTIDEEFRTDPLGQILEITRAPLNWRKVLGSLDHKP